MRYPSLPRGRATRVEAARGSTAPSGVDHPRHLNKPQGRRKPSCPSLLASETTREPTTSRFSLRSLIDVSPSLLPTCCFGAAPVISRHPKSDRLLAGAGINKVPLAAALRGERGPFLASLVAHGCSLTIVRYSTLQHNTPFPSREPKALFSHETRFNSIHVDSNHKSFCSSLKRALCRPCLSDCCWWHISFRIFTLGSRDLPTQQYAEHHPLATTKAHATIY